MFRLMSVFTSFLIVFILVLIGFEIVTDESSPMTTEEWEQEENPTIDSEEETRIEEDHEIEGSSTYNEKLGLYTSTEELKNSLGEPSEIFWTPYGYDWWLFEKELSPHLFGIKDGMVETMMILEDGSSFNNIAIGDSYEALNDHFEFDDVVELGSVMTSYVFDLTQNDMVTKPLIKLDSGDYAQLYFDKMDGALTAIRKQSEEILLIQRPYSLSYRGSLAEPEELSEHHMDQWQRGQEELIHLISNHFRDQKGLHRLEKAEDARLTARNHSKDMYSGGFFSHESPNSGSLGDRLSADGVNFQGAAENIAAHYIDSLEAVNGWLNSEGHRVNLLSDDFSYAASGVYDYYYTQNFINYHEN